jgi:hypothetical protein
MFSRSINFLLLFSIVCWGTGAAQCIHKHVEHAEQGDEEIPDAASALRASASTNRDQRHHPHEHDDCPTCQMLAHMAAVRTESPPLICIELPTFPNPVSGNRLLPVVDSYSYVPIRGPPTPPCSPGQMKA